MPGLNVAFNILGNNNGVRRGSRGRGPGAIAGLIGVNDQNFLTGKEVTNSDFGIELRTPFNVTNGMALNNLSVSGGGEKSGTQGGVVKQLLSFRPGGNAGTKAASLGGSGSSFKAVSDQINTSVKKLSEAVNNVTKNLTSGLAGGTTK